MTDSKIALLAVRVAFMLLVILIHVFVGPPSVAFRLTVASIVLVVRFLPVLFGQGQPAPTTFERIFDTVWLGFVLAVLWIP